MRPTLTGVYIDQRGGQAQPWTAIWKVRTTRGTEFVHDRLPLHAAPWADKYADQGTAATYAAAHPPARLASHERNTAA